MKKKNTVSNIKEKTQSDLVSSEEDSPSWYHYIAVLLIIFGGIWLLSFLVNSYTSHSDVIVNDALNSTQTYVYKKTLGNVTYNIVLSLPTLELKKFDFIIEPNKFDLLNTFSYAFSFGEYNGTDNGQVTLSATKFRRYLSLVHFVKFEAEDFTTLDHISCKNSTINERIVTFEINKSLETSSVLEEQNGCIRIVVNDPIEMPYLIDYFIISLLEDE